MIYGIELKLKKANQMLKKEKEKRGRNKNPEKIKRIELGISNLHNKIKQIKQSRNTKRK